MFSDTMIEKFFLELYEFLFFISIVYILYSLIDFIIVFYGAIRGKDLNISKNNKIWIFLVSLGIFFSYLF